MRLNPGRFVVWLVLLAIGLAVVLGVTIGRGDARSAAGAAQAGGDAAAEAAEGDARGEGTEGEAGPEATESGRGEDTGAEGADAGSGTHPGRAVYVDQNCALCHTAYARGIGEPPEDRADGEGGEAPEGEPGGPGDLSVLDERWTVELLRLYLVDREPVDGEKHVVGFRGEDDEWHALVEWLLFPAARADTAASDAPSETGSTEDPGSGEQPVDSRSRSREAREDK
ncbi:MAG: hypothetical protein GF400_06850 [Candidatus Eisenbacteria bacterium]|nr:hypothetical protein [Candidatus Eisenbacteria bacterium]